MCGCVCERECERERSNHETGTHVLNAGREMEKWPRHNWATAERWEETGRASSLSHVHFSFQPESNFLHQFFHRKATPGGSVATPPPPSPTPPRWLGCLVCRRTVQSHDGGAVFFQQGSDRLSSPEQRCQINSILISSASLGALRHVSQLR